MANAWEKYSGSVFSGKSMITLVICGTIAGAILMVLK